MQGLQDIGSRCVCKERLGAHVEAVRHAGEGITNGTAFRSIRWLPSHGNLTGSMMACTSRARTHSSGIRSRAWQGGWRRPHLRLLGGT